MQRDSDTAQPPKSKVAPTYITDFCPEIRKWEKEKIKHCIEMSDCHLLKVLFHKSVTFLTKWLILHRSKLQCYSMTTTIIEQDFVWQISNIIKRTVYVSLNQFLLAHIACPAY